jgi:hypothetical protein
VAEAKAARVGARARNLARGFLLSGSAASPLLRNFNDRTILEKSRGLFSYQRRGAGGGGARQMRYHNSVTRLETARRGRNTLVNSRGELRASRSSVAFVSRESRRSRRSRERFLRGICPGIDPSIDLDYIYIYIYIYIPAVIEIGFAARAATSAVLPGEY